MDLHTPISQLQLIANQTVSSIPHPLLLLLFWSKFWSLYHFICISFLWLPKQITTNVVVWNNRNLFFHSSGGQVFEIKVSEGLVPSRGSEGESILCLALSFWLAAGSPWCSLACRHITPVSASVITLPYLCMSPPLLLYRHLSLDLEPTVIQNESSF